jgi:multidrug efflux pump subunit AcrB
VSLAAKELRRARQAVRTARSTARLSAQRVRILSRPSDTQAMHAIASATADEERRTRADVARITAQTSVQVPANEILFFPALPLRVDAVKAKRGAAVSGSVMNGEHHAEVLGESTELNAAQDRLLLFGAIAAAAIFLLLQAAFGSLRLAILTFLLLPMALVGGVLAVWLGDGVLSLGSLVGFLTVFGIAARNGILMISHFQHLERHEGEAFGPSLVLRGATGRLAPILMAASATGLALVPLAIAGGLPGHEIEHPMAIVILGGLVTATLLNLFVLPSLYLRFAKSRKRAA